MNITQELARFTAESRPEHTQAAHDEGVRTLVDWLGCCLGGQDEAALAALRAPRSVADDTAQVPLPASGGCIDLPSAVLRAAVASHALDFCAEHAASGVAVGVAVASALVPLAQWRPASGARWLHAYTLGAEATCRLAPALTGAGRDSAAGTLSGGVGAAVACASLLGLDTQRTADAIGMTVRSLHDARTAGEPDGLAVAACSGLAAALRAQAPAQSGGAPPAQEADDDCLAAMCGSRAASLLDGLGREWHSRQIAYKAYACDRRLQAATEACLLIRSRQRPGSRQIAAVQVRLPACTLEHLGPPGPVTAAQARRSIHHAAAAALLEGRSGPEQFESPRLGNERMVRMRARVTTVADDTLAPQAAHVTVRMHDGGLHEQFVRCARGSLGRPMSDDELSTKFRALACTVLATGQAERLLALAWNVRALADAGALLRASVPEEGDEPAELPGSPLIPR